MKIRDVFVQSKNIHTESRTRLIDSVVAIGLGLFFVFITVDGVRIFQQFSWFQVVGLAVVFLAVALMLFSAFNFSEVKVVRFTFSLRALLFGALLGVALCLLSLTALGNWSAYFPSSPLSELDAGRGLHPDTVFHVSLIQSILNFGYPSTGQHGLPLLPYHVLSHYVDAGILAITGLEPLDAYGLLFHFKVFAFLSLSTLVLWVILRNRSLWWFASSIVLFIPALAGNWIVIGSEGLWFTSLLVLASAPLVYRIITADSFSTKHMTVLALLGIAIGFGKVSSGLAFALLVGFFLFFNNVKNPRVYILGFVWVGFFALFSVAQGSGSGEGIKIPHLSGITGFLNPWTTYPGGPVEWNLVGIYILIALMLCAWWWTKNTTALLLSVAALISLFLLSLLMMLPAPDGLTQPDIAYFVLGLYFSLLLLGFITLVETSSLIEKERKSRQNTWKQPVFLVLVVLSSLLLPKPDLFGLSLQPQSLPSKGIAQEFRAKLASFMSTHGLTKQNTYLIIPKEEFDTSIAAWGSPYWSEGMNVYALTGVPLLFGITDTSVTNFGQSGYELDAHSINKVKLNFIKCHQSDVIVHFHDLSFHKFDCDTIR